MKGKKILIVDDDKNVIELLSIYLRKEGAVPIVALDGKSAIETAFKELPDLMVLDLMLPVYDGWQVCQRIRAQGIDVPIIMLTAKGEDYDKLLGFQLGADDYVTKPFNPAELIARIKAILRRTSLTDDSKNMLLRYPSLKIDRTKYEVYVEGNIIPFTPKEIELLWYMARSPGRVFTREQLLQQVWDYDYIGDVRTVDVHIKRIREKLSMAIDPP